MSLPYKDIYNEHKEQANEELASQLTTADKVIYLDGCVGRTSEALRHTGAQLVLVERDPDTFNIHRRARPWANPVLGDMIETIEVHPDATAIYFDGMGTIATIDTDRLRAALANMPKLRIYWHTLNTRNNQGRGSNVRKKWRSSCHILKTLGNIVPMRMTRTSKVKKHYKYKKEWTPIPYKKSMVLIKFKHI